MKVIIFSIIIFFVVAIVLFYIFKKPELITELKPELITELKPELITELKPELITAPQIKTIILTFNDQINGHIAQMDFVSRNIIYFGTIYGK
jgi:hypothetical protein